MVDSNSSSPIFNVFDIEIYQGDEIVKVPVPYGTLESFARMFLNEHVDVPCKLFVAGMRCVKL